MNDGVLAMWDFEWNIISWSCNTKNSQVSWLCTSTLPHFFCKQRVHPPTTCAFRMCPEQYICGYIAQFLPWNLRIIEKDMKWIQEYARYHQPSWAEYYFVPHLILKNFNNQSHCISCVASRLGKWQLVVIVTTLLAFEILSPISLQQCSFTNYPLVHPSPYSPHGNFFIGNLYDEMSTMGSETDVRSEKHTTISSANCKLGDKLQPHFTDDPSSWGDGRTDEKCTTFS